MNKYQRLLKDLTEKGSGKMKCFGNSMTPILESGTLNTYQVQDNYRVGDIVFCRVKGRYIDAHKIIQISDDGRYLIANNHNHQNGWTKKIYGKVIQAEFNGKIKEFK